jgi:hypothetical protein
MLFISLWLSIGLALALPVFLLDYRRYRMPKTYGPDTVPEIPTVPFSLNVIHEDPASGTREIRTHDFTGRPDPSAGDYHRFALASKEGGAGLMIVLADILPRLVANDDGVPFGWEYKALPGKVVADPKAAVFGTYEEPEEEQFRGPDGVIYPVTERKRFEEFDAGSSRRRLYNVMFEDANAKVSTQIVGDIMKDLFEAAGERPTRA